MLCYQQRKGIGALELNACEEKGYLGDSGKPTKRTLRSLKHASPGLAIQPGGV